MESANAFRLALSAAAEEMNRAAALLDRRQTGPATQQAEQVALSRLKMLLAALEPEKKANGAGNGGNADRPEPGPTGLPLALAQLKLLKLMQEDLNVRTQQLDQTAAGKPAEQFRQQYALLADEQGRLAATAIELLGTGPAKGPEGKEPP
jgi:hypothetical protein